ncbi:hypothetical protein [Streptomyces sp. NPDC002156]
MSVEINVRDIDLLRKFQKLTPYYSSVTERTRSTNFAETQHSATWSLCSLEARTRLNELGLPYGRKSKTIGPPHVEFAQRDYLRGLIDADGSVGFTGKGFPFVSLTTASTDTGAYLCSYAKQVTGAERLLKRNTRDNIYNVFYTMETAQNLAAHLYYPGCLSLERKQTAADSFANWARPGGMRAAYTQRRWNEREDRVLLELNSPQAAAEALGRTAQSCNLRAWRLRTGQVPMPSDQ